jgi:hypothetical protein
VARRLLACGFHLLHYWDRELTVDSELAMGPLPLEVGGRCSGPDVIVEVGNGQLGSAACILEA